MKRMAAALLCLTLTFFLAACGANEGSKPSETSAPVYNKSNVPPAEGTGGAGSRVLIAYFSVPENVNTKGVDAIAGASIVVKDGEKLGNTEYVAKLIQQTIGGDLFRIETVEPYPLEHDTLVDQAADEKNGGCPARTGGPGGEFRPI